ncbi:endoflagellar protein [Sporanaerobium hydrogeniformans]|uniref:Endoflagellar protein n=1 Tax=Sporanaerobium hydrogeniformans TaxID=3072179 RepID=A0AC61DHI1_9FIRM|nr:flagellar FlbD family protein [Sporanaerobium hydrogeniformans]PHV71747.1 endoflagellar protein [Sporanaerobium hydrogeniformans]
MITVTRLNHQELTLNSDLIETLEQTPDTVITMTTGNKFIVIESTAEIIKRIIDYKRKILQVVEE